MIFFATLLVLHLLAAIVWVGGMFFVRVVLLPALEVGEAPQNFAVLAHILPNFFRNAWLAVAGLLLTGYGVLLLGYNDGLGGGGVHVDIMQGLGWVLILALAYLDFGPFRIFLRARAAGDLDRAALKLAALRDGLTVTVALGMLTSVVGISGSLWAY